MSIENNFSVFNCRNKELEQTQKERTDILPKSLIFGRNRVLKEVTRHYFSDPPVSRGVILVSKCHLNFLMYWNLYGEV